MESRKMQYNRKMINGVVFLEEQADYLLLLGKEGLYTVQAENDHWNVHYTLPGDTSNLDKQFISKDEALQDVYEMDIWRRNRWKFLPMKELRTRLKASSPMMAPRIKMLIEMKKAGLCSCFFRLRIFVHLFVFRIERLGIGVAIRSRAIVCLLRFRGQFLFLVVFDLSVQFVD